MSKHTPEVTSGGYTGRIIDENGDTVAIVSNYDQALLMASASKLLEALKRFVDVCDNGNPIDIFNALGSCVEPARQAIAEAEGAEFYCSEWSRVGYICDEGQCEKCAKTEGKL